MTELDWESIIAAAKRENNQKRSFVVVNRLQGKHVPASPTAAIQMFDCLAEALRQQAQAACLVIGFAETATAIGLAVAQKLGCFSMTTTRESLRDVSYLYFSEAHSHATEQKLVKDDLDHIIGAVQQIIFVEDEITTGKTILQIVRLLRQVYGAERIQFTAASLLNGMDAENLEQFRQEQIECVYLYKTNPAVYDVQARQYQADGGECHILQAQEAALTVSPLVYAGDLDLRRLQQPEQILQQCTALCDWLQAQIPLRQGEQLLLLGTEEFMYPALAVGKQLEEQGVQVWCHATTRSPIVPVKADTYPLTARWQLCSVYEETRSTYVYNLRSYDKVIILTDAPIQTQLARKASGLHNLTAALRQVGNTTVYAVEWRRL